MKRKILAMSIVLLNANVYADEDLDWELDFSIDQKSTKEDFPLREISQAELSNAAIPGALKVVQTGQSSRDARPAHAQEAEKNDKRKVEELETSENEDLTKDASTIFIIPDIPPIEFQQQTYKAPDGRDYGRLETNTVERP